jgi:hypothetical protein
LRYSLKGVLDTLKRSRLLKQVIHRPACRGNSASRQSSPTSNTAHSKPNAANCTAHTAQAPLDTLYCSRYLIGTFEDDVEN